ncbi:hypothetical protein [Pedobacter namyangjuensis]|uniref:hypothetical protein n=1 Tax=Pedobacter namyangjuensis TaxID=600626 RepID=UPI000DE51C12|nr:hypothetical protein [Pedobacter namyangjuensis]
MENFLKKTLFLMLVMVGLNATAQWDPGATQSLGMGHGFNALSQSVMSNTFNNANKGTSKAENADYIYFGFSNFRGFEEKIFNQLVANDKNVDKGKIRRFLSDSRTMHQFNIRSRDFGLKDTYISDILATGIAWNWEMYHQTKSSKQKVINLRNAIRGNMAKGPVKTQIAKLSATDKTDWMMSFMYNNAMLAQTIKNTGKLTATQKQQLAQTAKQAGVENIASVSLK